MDYFKLGCFLVLAVALSGCVDASASEGRYILDLMDQNGQDVNFNNIYANNIDANSVTSNYQINVTEIDLNVLNDANFQGNVGIAGSLFANAADFAGAVTGIALNEIGNPEANKTFTMANRTLSFSFVNPSDLSFEIETLGAFTGDLFHVHQHTGNPGAGTILANFEADDSDVLGMRIETTNPVSLFVSDGDVNINDDLKVGGNVTATSAVLTTGVELKPAGSTQGTMSMVGNDLTFENTVNGGNVKFVTVNGLIDFATYDMKTTGDFTDGTNAVSASEAKAASDHVSNDGSDHSFINQGVGTGDSPTFTELRIANSYEFTERAGVVIDMENKDSGQVTAVSLFAQDGDKTDGVAWGSFGLGSPSSQLTNLEYYQNGWNTGGYFQFRIINAGTGKIRPLIIWSTGDVNQAVFDTGGRIKFAGVYNDDIGTERDLLIQADGQIGYDSSSAEYKENIVDLPDATSEKLYSLQPRLYDKIGGRQNQIGLIAEEVDQLFPEFVSYKREEIMGFCENVDINGKPFQEPCVVEYRETNIPETVNYKKLIVPAVQEIQKVEARTTTCEERLDRIENCIATAKDFLAFKACANA